MKSLSPTVRCELCKRELGIVTPSHLNKFHPSWTTESYRNKFPNSPMRIFSDQTRQKMSKARLENFQDSDFRCRMTKHLCKGRKLTAECRRKMSKVRTGKKHKPETIERLRAINTGKKMSKAACRKISIKASLRHPQCKGYHSAKTGKKILYRSGWELCYFLSLEYDPKVVSYAVEPILIPYTDTEGKKRFYRPDVLVTSANGLKQLVEIKAQWAVNYGNNPAKFKAGASFAEERGWKFVLITENDFNFDRTLIRSLAAQFEIEGSEQTVQRPVGEVNRTDNPTTSAEPLEAQGEEMVRHSGEIRRAKIKSLA